MTLEVLQNLSDEELCLLAQKGDKKAENILIERSRTLVNIETHSLYIVSGDMEDLVQEGMIGLYKSIRDYEEGKSSFKTFARCCIKRNIFSAIKSDNRDKNKPLNNYISLNAGAGDDINAIDVLVNREVVDPETQFINTENLNELQEKIKTVLSKFEYNVLKYYVSGYSYAYISEKLGKPQKAVDNAVQRIKSKVKNIINGV